MEVSLRADKKADGGSDVTLELRSWRAALHAEELVEKPVEPARQNFVVDSHQSGLMMITPSIVGVPARTSSITSFNRSPAAARKLIGVVFNSLGVTPAVPPPWTGVLSWIVSEPEKIVTRLPVVVERIKSTTEAGQGTY